MSGKDNKGSIRFEIQNFSDLAKATEHKPVQIGHVEWILGAFTSTSDATNNVKHLGIHLKCNEELRSNLWSCDASIRFSLLRLNSNEDDDAFSMEFQQKFDDLNKIFVVNNFKNWEEAICYDNRFVLDKHAVLEVQITVNKIVGIHERIIETFDQPKEHLTDVVLVLEGKHVHVGKQVLATSSKFFQKMFYSNFAEKTQAEIKIEDVTHSEFIDLLNMIYPTHMLINKSSNVAHLLKLSDRFAVPRVLEKAEKFLISDQQTHLIDKLKFAEVYKLSRLQNACLSQLETSENVTALKHHENYESLDHITYNALLQKLIDLLEGEEEE